MATSHLPYFITDLLTLGTTLELKHEFSLQLLVLCLGLLQDGDVGVGLSTGSPDIRCGLGGVAFRHIGVGQADVSQHACGIL